MSVFLRWLKVWLGFSLALAVMTAVGGMRWPPDFALIGVLAPVLGGFLTIVVGLMHASSSLDFFRNKKLHDQDPDWHYLTLSKLTAIGYLFGILFCFAWAAIAVGLGVYGVEGRGSWFGWVLVLFPLGLGAVNLPTTLFSWFSEWRWNEEQLERRNPLIGLRADKFSDIKSAGVWPLVGLIGIRFSDGQIARIHQEVPGVCGLYARLRRELGERFWGSSLQMHNELWDLGLDKEGRPLDET